MSVPVGLPKPRRIKIPSIQYYKVVPGGIEPCDLFTWAEQFGKGEHAIARTTLGNGFVQVCTICLGFDINWGMFGRVSLFESAVLWSAKAHWMERDIEIMDRYATYEEALAGHEEIVKVALKRCGGFLTCSTT